MNRIEIELKYFIGQEVFFISHRRIVKGVVTDYKIIVNSNSTVSCFEVICNGYKETFPEDVLFPSKQAILDFLDNSIQ